MRNKRLAIYVITALLPLATQTDGGTNEHLTLFYQDFPRRDPLDQLRSLSRHAHGGRNSTTHAVGSCGGEALLHGQIYVVGHDCPFCFRERLCSIKTHTVGMFENTRRPSQYTREPFTTQHSTLSPPSVSDSSSDRCALLFTQPVDCYSSRRVLPYFLAADLHARFDVLKAGIPQQAQRGPHHTAAEGLIGDANVCDIADGVVGVGDRAVHGSCVPLH